MVRRILFKVMMRVCKYGGENERGLQYVESPGFHLKFQAAAHF
jgi:hypothetical protein